MESDEKVCPRCAETIKAAAVVCRHCGHEFAGAGKPAAPVPAPEKKRSKLVTGCGAIAAIILGIIVLGAIFGSPDKKAAASGDAPQAAAAPALAVTANELARAYEANEQAAQKQYGGQPLAVTGTIASIALDVTDDPMVSLSTNEMFKEVTLHFSKDFADKTAELRKGQKFTATCETVSEIMSFPQLSDCSF